MWTSRPTTWPAFTFPELFARPPHSARPCLWLLRRLHPTNKLIPPKGGEVIPEELNLWIRVENCVQVLWQGMRKT